MAGREGGEAAFQTTSWTLLQGLHANDERQRRESLEVLARVYWPPIYAYLRRLGRPPEEAADLTQGFFSDVVVRRGLLDGADPERGRLRDLIRTALRRYVIDAHRTTRRPRDRQLVSLDAMQREERLLNHEAATPHDEAFDRRWALALLQEAMRRTEAYFVAASKAEHWRIFEARVVRPATRCAEPPSLPQLAEAYGFANAADASAAIQVVKKRLLAILQQVAAEAGDGSQASGQALKAMLG